MYKYSNFDELYKHFDKVSLGYEKYDIANPKDMEKYYSKEEQEKYRGYWNRDKNNKRWKVI